jgi:hypothetical protein
VKTDLLIVLSVHKQIPPSRPSGIFRYKKWDEFDFPQYEKYTKDAADYLGATFEMAKGTSAMLRDFINGKWDEDRFLVTQPGQTIVADYSDAYRIITAE